ncbi:MAG: FG-GAP-like repeat-containing protein [Phycisphaerales bacterium]|nr:FG-GAP-like repeat-containing protein [Phycisphaerales bacterium]
MSEARRSLPGFLTNHVRLLVIACAAMLTPATAMAQGVNWLCPEGGSFEDASCWSSSTVPTSGDFILFDLGDTYRLILPDPAMGYQEVSGMSIVGDDVTFDIQNIYRYFYAGGYFSLERSSEARSNQTAFRILNGDVSASTFALFDGTLELDPTSGIMVEDLLLSEGSTIKVNVGEIPWYAAVSMYNAAPGSLDLNGSLVITTPVGESEIPLGSTRTILQTNSTGDLTINTPFPSVFTNPPLGREFVITGNEVGSTMITAELVYAETYADDEFSEPDSIPSEAVAVVTGDLTNNGLDDIVLVMPDDKIRIYETTASGSTLGPYEYPVGSDPVDAAIGDYDGNGFNDIVVLNQSDSTCSVYLNDFGDPSDLRFYSDYSTPDTPTAVVNCDLGDGDSKGSFQPVAAQDIVIVSKGGGGRASGYRGGSGGLVNISSIIIEEEPDSADPADDEEKKDEDDDIVVGHGAAAAGFTNGTSSPSLTLIRGNRDGSLEILQENIQVASVPNEMAALTIDGTRYIAVGTEGGTIELYSRDTSASGSLSFFSSNHVGQSVVSIAASDLDGDSRKDIVASVGDSDNASLSLFLNKSNSGTGTVDFQAAGQVEFNDPTGRLAVGPLFDDGGQRINGVAGTTAPLSGGSANLFTGFYFEAETPGCVAADFNGDGEINGFDLGQLIAAWGPCPGSGCPEDINGDGVVNGADLGLLFNVWGPCSEG